LSEDNSDEVTFAAPGCCGAAEEPRGEGPAKDAGGEATDEPSSPVRRPRLAAREGRMPRVVSLEGGTGVGMGMGMGVEVEVDTAGAWALVR
jgi:hypothetical protein